MGGGKKMQPYRVTFRVVHQQEHQLFVFSVGVQPPKKMVHALAEQKQKDAGREGHDCRGVVDPGGKTVGFVQLLSVGSHHF